MIIALQANDAACGNDVRFAPTSFLSGRPFREIVPRKELTNRRTYSIMKMTKNA